MISSLKNLIYKSRKLFGESQISFNNLDLLLLKTMTFVALIVALVSFFMITYGIIQALKEAGSVDYYREYHNNSYYHRTYSNSVRNIIKDYFPYYILPIIFLLISYFTTKKIRQEKEKSNLNNLNLDIFN